MQNLIKAQIKLSQSGLDHEKITFRSQKPEDVVPNHQAQTLNTFSEYTHFLAAFIIIFGTLLTYSNWSAYALIAQDWINTAFATEYSSASIISAPICSNLSSESCNALQKIREENNALYTKNKENHQKTENILANLDVKPPGMWLEIPKLFEGKVPIVHVENPEKLNFAADYNTTESEFQKTLEKGVLHYPNTASPGNEGNVFLTGHSSYYPWAPGEYKEIFALLHKLEIGDTYSITNKGETYTYKVHNKFEVQPSEVEVLQQPKNQRISTLMTCTPVGTTLRRLIIQAEEI
jgi:LPXTG-site transpeptidase (sortase) family protein